MKLMWRVSSMTLEEPMRKRHNLNPYPTWAQVKKHDSSGWADTEEQKEHHNCSWFNRSSIGGFHKSKTSFWTDKDILLNWCNGGLSPPRPRIVIPIVGPEQWHIWKIPAALETLPVFMGLWVCFVLLIIPSYILVLAIFNNVFTFRTCLL